MLEFNRNYPIWLRRKVACVAGFTICSIEIRRFDFFELIIFKAMLFILRVTNKSKFLLLCVQITHSYNIRYDIEMSLMPRLLRRRHKYQTFNYLQLTGRKHNLVISKLGAASLFVRFFIFILISFGSIYNIHVHMHISFDQKRVSKYFVVVA